MLYAEFSRNAKRLTVLQDEDSKIWYLDPDWLDKLYRNGLGDLSSLEDSYIKKWTEVENILKLEVEMRNAIDSKERIVIDGLYEIFSKPYLVEKLIDIALNNKT